MASQIWSHGLLRYILTSGVGKQRDLNLLAGLKKATSWWGNYTDLRYVNDYISRRAIAERQQICLDNINRTLHKKYKATLEQAYGLDIAHFLNQLNTFQPDASLNTTIEEAINRIYQNVGMLRGIISDKSTNIATVNSNLNLLREANQEAINNLVFLRDAFNKSKNGVDIQTVVALLKQLESAQEYFERIAAEGFNRKDLTIKNLKDFFSGKNLNNIQGYSLEEIGTAAVAEVLDKITSDGKVNAQVVHTGKLMYNGQADKTDIRVIVDDFANAVKDPANQKHISLGEVDSSILSKTVIGIQAKSGRAQVPFNANVSLADLTRSGMAHYFERLNSLYHEPNTTFSSKDGTYSRTIAWNQIRTKDESGTSTPYYNNMAAWGLAYEFERLMQLNDNFNTVLLTPHGFQLYPEWFRNNILTKNHIIKFQNNVDITKLTQSMRAIIG